MQTDQRINYIKSWILDYCKSMPKEAETLVVGISGGIDSSVTSTICALTGKRTIVLSMPINQIKEQQVLSLKMDTSDSRRCLVLCWVLDRQEAITFL